MLIQINRFVLEFGNGHVFLCVPGVGQLFVETRKLTPEAPREVTFDSWSEVLKLEAGP